MLNIWLMGETSFLEVVSSQKPYQPLHTLSVGGITYFVLELLESCVVAFLGLVNFGDWWLSI
jgi:hypothetical protein